MNIRPKKNIDILQAMLWNHLLAIKVIFAFFSLQPYIADDNLDLCLETFS
jgi:hypothetical protein